MRLKNEEEWVGACLESILPIFDDSVVCLQRSTDQTEAIVRSFNDSKIRLFRYPFDSHPNGPGHDQHPEDSVHARAYFYNWSLQKTRCQFACKWDGDAVAMDGLRDDFRDAVKRADRVRFYGVDIAGDAWTHTSKEPFTAYEPSLFRVTSQTFYENGPECERMHKPAILTRLFNRYTPFGTKQFDLARPAFLHFKWAKSFASASKAWPNNWQELPHFQSIIERKASPGEPYRGDYPQALRKRMAQRQADEVAHG